MKKILSALYNGQRLSYAEAREALCQLNDGKTNQAQLASFMTVFLIRPVTAEELKGFRDALLELALAIEFEAEVMDVCGTGGDEKNTFNISTLAALVMAGAGVKIAKHGNYGVSSVSGSSNILEFFGYKFTNETETLKKQMEDCNICFLHAPLFHPALKSVAPVRKELGVKTFFNMLGPLVNPARPFLRMAGVYNKELGRTYHSILQQEKGRYRIVCSEDGYDEISLTAPFQYFSEQGQGRADHHLFNIEKNTPEQLMGGESLSDAAAIFKNVLENKALAAQTNTVIANAAFGIQCAKQTDIEEATAMARNSLLSGTAKKIFTQLINYN